MNKALPAGVMNYQKLKTGGYYSVDKTMMIHEFLQRRSEVTLITRPRRFGKTLNMSMMSEFFDITKDSTELFKNTKIMQTEYATEMNQYPVIFLSFADCKGDIDEIKMSVFYLLRLEMAKHLDLLQHKNVKEDLKKRYHELYEDMCDETEWKRIQFMIVTVCELLYTVYQKQVMVLIDEYDTPFVEAHIHDCYKELHSPMAGMLSRALKTNAYLGYAMLTGIQRVAKENIFSGLNNLIVCTVNDHEYDQYFGFTKEETKELLTYYHLEYNDQVKEMYDGYHMGSVDIYNPWSIISYADRKKLMPYWLNTSSNSMIKKAMEHSEASFKSGYEDLIQNGYLDTEINIETSFYEQSSTNSLWGLFVNAGYLTISKTIDLENNEYRLRIPNKEVEREFKELTAYHLHVETQDLSDLHKAIKNKNRQLFIDSYEKLLLVNASYHDLINENSYQAPWPAVRMLLLGICLYVKYEYEIISNREEGKGRCDLILKSKKKTLPSYVIEVKYMSKDDYSDNKEVLQQLAQDALNQIDKQRYDIELTGEIIHIGLAHSGKDVEIAWIEK